MKQLSNSLVLKIIRVSLWRRLIFRATRKDLVQPYIGDVVEGVAVRDVEEEQHCVDLLVGRRVRNLSRQRVALSFSSLREIDFLQLIATLVPSSSRSR